MGGLRCFARTADLCSEDFKQFLDQLAVASGRDDRIHTIAELHQPDAPLVVHREADDSLQRRGPGVVKRDLDVSGYVFAVVRGRQLQLNPSPEESTSSRPEPPLDPKHSRWRAFGYNYWVTTGGIKVLVAGNVYPLFLSCTGCRWLYEFNRLRHPFGHLVSITV